MKIDNLKLRTKTLVPLVLMATVVFAMVALGASRLIGISRSEQIITRLAVNSPFGSTTDNIRIPPRA